MSLGESDQILALIRKALDEFDEVAVATSLSRAIRIAYLIGDTDAAWRFTLDAKPTGGTKTFTVTAVAELWPDLDYDARREMHSKMVEDFIEDRRIDVPPVVAEALYGGLPEGSLMAGSVLELEQRERLWRDEIALLPIGPERARSTAQMSVTTDVIGRVRHRIFTSLCLWERRLLYVSTNVRIFDTHRSRVDAMLASSAPDVMDRLNAAYRRVPEGDPESMSQALMSCRRILKATADAVYPPGPPAKGIDGVERAMGEEQYIRRLWQYASQALIGAKTRRRLLTTTLEEFGSRIDRLYDLTNKGVHEEVSSEEVDLCVIQTYLLCGEILALSD